MLVIPHTPPLFTRLTIAFIHSIPPMEKDRKIHDLTITKFDGLLTILYYTFHYTFYPLL